MITFYCIDSINGLPVDVKEKDYPLSGKAVTIRTK